MASAERGMGRGLSAILPPSARHEQGLRDVAVELIQPNPRQPRRHFDEDALAALSESIRERGLLQPIVVRPLPGGTYELVVGERRLRAARLAGLQTVPALAREAEDGERLELALAENVAREDLNPIEEARACATLVEDLRLTKEEVGRRVGRSRVAVSNLIRLLELPDEVLALVESGALSEGHGRALLTCQDHDARCRLALRARDEGWSVRETERRARDHGRRPRPAREAVVVHPDLAVALAAAEDALTAALGHEAKARPRGEGCRIQLDFGSPTEAVELAEKLLARAAARR